MIELGWKRGRGAPPYGAIMLGNGVWQVLQSRAKLPSGDWSKWENVGHVRD